MLPSLVIGLREGLEAALIVGIVAAFLRANGRLDLLKWVWAGVIAAVVLCLAVGIGLRVASENLPYRQQEALETVIAIVAIAMVTYMVVWMRRHSRDMKASLEGSAGAAIESGSGWALVAMAFLAVLREGFETAVFLVAAFNESDNPRAAGSGALIGIVIACVLGYGIYRGGVRINLARFFKVTGVVLVLVAAGLVVSALHSAHEAGWVNVGQQRVADLTWLVDPGSVRSSLLTGILGLQPRPVLIELAGWLLYLVPVLAFVLWPARRPFPRRAALVAAAVATIGGVAGAVVLGVAEPSQPDLAATRLATADGPLDVAVQARDADGVVLQLAGDAVATAGADAEPLEVTATAHADEQRGGRDTTAYVAVVDAPAVDDGELSIAEVAARNGGRLPLGVNANTTESVPVQVASRQTVTVWLDDETGRVIDAEVSLKETSIGEFPSGPLPLGSPATETISTTTGSADEQGALAAAAARQLERIDTFQAWQRGLIVLAVAGVVSAAALWRWGRIRGPGHPPSARSVAAHPV